MNPPLILIAAIAENGVIGRDNSLPWHLTSDLKRFRALTMGKPMIMGRKNFQSIGRPLPGRETIVVTRDRDFTAEGVHIVYSIEDALACAAERASAMQAQEIILAGGAELYSAMIDDVDRMKITFVDLAPEGDTFFPAINWSQWGEESRVRPPKDAKDDATFSFVDYRRR
ncbi:dihydrofolate reductase [Methyloferula stellata]|uniref:dihydrofolate reductase n=1 Tax=Methyloferula stellata TaxID=876270 RepID=UPI0003704D0B|nr:dihydrofolate reductase [Methyloferula stellata]